ncbi:MAG: ABC transporter permease/M1 family aminopeptidase, partial [Planctomycetota bacterium]
LRGARHGAIGAAPPETGRTAALPAAGGHDVVASLRMSRRPPGLLPGIMTVARFELKELRIHPGLYLFTPFILIQALATALLQVGPFDTPLLHTPGGIAVSAMNTLTLLVCMLLLFYTVESQLRERTTGLAPIYYASSVRTGSIIFGKTVANAVVGTVVLLAALLGCIIALLVQRAIPVSLWPFLLVWGLMMVPTFMVWSAMVAAVVAITRNRYTTYAVALAVFVYTLYRQLTGGMNWVGNWNIWNVGPWSDISTFELNRSAIVLNRLMVVGLSVFLTAVTVRFFGRRSFDAAQVIHRLRPLPLARTSLRLAPFLVVPLVCGVLLWTQITSGYQGPRNEKRSKEYWKQNLATWKDAPLPALGHVELDVQLEPAERRFEVDGHYVVKNVRDEPLRRVPVTGGQHWENISWSLDGSPYEPDDRSRLFVFTFDPPLAPAGEATIGFSYDGVFPRGVSKNGGGAPQFILPSGVVLHSFSTSFAPVLGYVEAVGVDEDNRYEPRHYDDDFHLGLTDPLFGAPTPYTTRIRVSGPERMRYNSVGSLVSEEVVDGRRTAVWQSDFPVTFFNIVAGEWSVREGNGTKIFYHPEHEYNIDEISAALDAARKYYSEWFMEYPWRELKLSEFPALASYAQGFPTNITFSEAIGFLTKSDPRTNMAFMVTAHEAAHQWWGNLLQPGKGPGGNILSEGMAHFSTILLLEQCKGQRERIEFCKRIEEGYGEGRRVDAERAMVRTDGSKSGDRRVMYDKGGWVFWMLLNRMGRDRALAGIREFIRSSRESPDFPVLQDFVASMRTHAVDPADFDQFVDQWFFDVVMPEYRLTEVDRRRSDESWEVTATVENRGTGLMPVEIAAVRGDRFDADGETGEDYRESRTTVTLGPGDSTQVILRCDFEPQQLIVDPDALVLQLKRTKALHRF